MSGSLIPSSPIKSGVWEKPVDERQEVWGPCLQAENQCQQQRAILVGQKLGNHKLNKAALPFIQEANHERISYR